MSFRNLSQTCRTELSIRSADQKRRPKVSLRGVDQKCRVRVFARVAQKRRSEALFRALLKLSFRKVSPKVVGSGVARGNRALLRRRSRVSFRSVAQRCSEILLRNVAQKFRPSLRFVEQKRRSKVSFRVLPRIFSKVFAARAVFLLLAIAKKFRQVGKLRPSCCFKKIVSPVACCHACATCLAELPQQMVSANVPRRSLVKLFSQRASLQLQTAGLSARDGALEGSICTWMGGLLAMRLANLSDLLSP